MPRPAWFFASLALLAVTPASAAQPIDGWNGYKFGMSPDAARAVPGAAFGAYSPKNEMNENIGSMSTKTVMLNGRAYAMDLYFNASQKLNRVHLENQVTAARPDCEKRFLDLVTLLEKPYGRFLAVNPQRQRNTAETPQVALAWKKQGASSYQVSTIFLDGETASAWKARNVQSGNYVDIDASWSGKTDSVQSACVTGIDFNGK